MQSIVVERSPFTAPRWAVITLLLVLITLAAFWQVYQFDFVNYDDDRYVFHNPHVNTGLKPKNITWAFQTMHTGNWHPLTWLSLMLDGQFFGSHAGGYHTVNLFFHLLNTLLVYMVLQTMTGAPWRSAAVSALFAVHPLHIESVAWISERKDVLSTFFMLLTLLAYVRYTRRPSCRTYLPVVIGFALGLLAKPMVVTLPFILLLMDYWPLKRFGHDTGSIPQTEGKSPTKTIGQLLYEKLPLFGLTILSIIVTLSAQRAEIITMQYLPLSFRMSNALVSYGEYLTKTIWPLPLAVLYPHPERILLWQTIGSAAALAIITAAVVRTARSYPYLLVGWLWYLGTLVPVIGIVQVGVQAMADRYTYIPLIGLFIAAVWLLSDWTDRAVYRKYILPAFGIAVILLFFVLTRTQVGHWRNSQALFSHALSVTKSNYVMHTNMGALLALQGNGQDAISHYQQALKIRPGDPETNYNLGNILMRQGKFKEAIPYFQKTLQSKPAYAAAHNNLGIAFGQSGDHERALEHFREAVRLDPDYTEAKGNLAYALAQAGNPKSNRPENAPAEPTQDNRKTADGQVKAGTSLVAKGDLAGAIGHFREAVRLNPDHYEANVHLGLSLAHQRNFAEAIPFFRKAIQINSKRPEIYNSLGVALANTGKIEEAIGYLKKAIQVDPDFAKAHNSLGVILAKSGKIDEALSHLQEAVRLQPDYPEAKRNLEIVQSIKAGQ
jgi:tetratricopeptide (TPR) repeat protein